MWTALLIGVIGSSALVIGAVVGSWWSAPAQVTGVLLAFASGALIAALAFELFPEAVEVGGLGPSVLGLFVGAIVFVVVNALVDARVASGAGGAARAGGGDAADAAAGVPDALDGAEADQSDKLAHSAAGRGGASTGPGIAFALLAAVTLDGVPENLALGVTLEGVGGELSGVTALLVAVFVSNLPESLVGSIAMRSAGRSRGFVVSIWAATAAVLTLAVVAGDGLASQMSPGALAFALAFAGGAVLASLADTLMPEAFEHGRPFNALSTALGFLLAFVLAHPG
ncbi:ZIP family metal transporter [Ilumatobacter sp.]|uniref:ZIP family metal transporter n=1 Tax=Ilumatobacter sp. TaxID=1967498 RepID=UPI003B52E7F6